MQMKSSLPYLVSSGSSWSYWSIRSLYSIETPLTLKGKV